MYNVSVNCTFVLLTVPPKMPEPYQIPISENDESNGVVEDVSYATTQHNREVRLVDSVSVYGRTENICPMHAQHKLLKLPFNMPMPL